MKNLELFELQTAEVFKILYEVFPVPVDIYFHQVTPKLQAVCLFVRRAGRYSRVQG